MKNFKFLVAAAMITSMIGSAALAADVSTSTSATTPVVKSDTGTKTTVKAPVKKSHKTKKAIAKPVAAKSGETLDTSKIDSTTK